MDVSGPSQSTKSSIPANLYTNMSLREVAATVSCLLDRHNIPSVLWGNLMLTVWGVPSIVDGVSFIVSDENVDSANSALVSAGFKECFDTQTCIASVEPRASPAPTAHVHVDQEVCICLFKHSETLPEIAKLQILDQEQGMDSDIILATNPKLPCPRPGRGEGRFATSLSPVRIPSAHRLIEGYIKLILKYRFHKYEFFFMSMFSYISEYVARDGLLNKNHLDTRYRKLLLEYQKGEKGLPQLLMEQIEENKNAKC